MKSYSSRFQIVVGINTLPAVKYKLPGSLAEIVHSRVVVRDVQNYYNVFTAGEFSKSWKNKHIIIMRLLGQVIS